MMDSKTGRPNRVRTAVFCSVLLMTGFATVQPVSAKSAKSARPAGWLATGVGVGGAYVALKNNLLKQLPDTLDKATGGFVEGDDRKVHEATSEVDGVAVDIVTDAFPVLGVVETTVEKAKEVAKSVKRKVSRFVEQAKEAAVDARVALTGLKRKGSSVAEGILDPEPLSTPVVSVSPRARVDTSSPWDAAGTASAKTAADPWGSKRAPGVWDVKDNKGAKYVFEPQNYFECSSPRYEGDVDACKRRFVALEKAHDAAFKALNEGTIAAADYRDALNKVMGTAASGGDYMAALREVEKKNEERKAAEAAERQRREEERRAAELAERLEADRQARELARRRAREKRETEAKTRRMLKNTLQNMQNVGRQIERRRRENERQAARARAEQERQAARAREEQERQRKRQEHEARVAAYRSCRDAVKRAQQRHGQARAQLETARSQRLHMCLETWRTVRHVRENTRCYEEWEAELSNWVQANPYPQSRCQSPSSGGRR